MERTATRNLVLARAYAIAKYIALAFVITLSFAFLYWGLCMLTPTLSKSYLMIPVFGKSIKLANLLRAFTLWTPWAEVGCSVGQQWFDSSIGMPPPFSIDTWAHIAAGFGAYYWAKTWGRSTIKDLLVLIVYGIVGSLISTVNASFIGVAFLASTIGTGFVELFKGAILFKTITKTTMILLGYPLAKAVVALTGGAQNEGSTTQ
jgi:hypothetical protein